MLQLLKQTISVRRATVSNSNNLGIATSYTDAYTNVAASVQPVTSSVQMYYAERQLRVTQTIFVAGTLALQRGDLVNDGTLNYNVVGWRDLSGRGKVMAIDCDLNQP